MDMSQRRSSPLAKQQLAYGCSSSSAPKDARTRSALTGDDDLPQPRLPAGGHRKLARPKRGRSSSARASPKPRLFTATIAYADGGVMIQAFHASVARHPAEVVQRLRSRFGDEIVAIAEIRIGFYPASPLAVSLVPSAVADMIRQTERNVVAPSALEFAVDIEQRIEI